jgi:short subunit dehydrogenase-like uncharacterized protein
MAGRIVVFGATGYTGALTARALVDRGTRPVLAGRNRERLSRLAAELDVETAVADVDRPASVRALVERGDVLVTTVGPYLRFGKPATDAAVDAGAHYFDATGEGPFIREMFESYGARARRAGCALLPAFGYDFVPGNLAAALALRQAADGGLAAAGVDVFYVTSGFGASAGTMASGVVVMLRPGFAFRAGRLTAERQAAHVAPFRWEGRDGAGMSISGSEHFSLPRLYPEVRDIRVYLGVLGASTWQLRAASAAMAPAQTVEPLGRMVERAWSLVPRPATGGPSEQARRRNRAGALARVLDPTGATRAEVRLEGGDPYEFTAAMLAWGAIRAATGGLQDIGALGPVEGFGVDELRAGAQDAGMGTT